MVKKMSNTKKSAFLNYVSTAMIHENQKKDGSGSLINVSIPCPQSKTGYASFAVNPGQVLAATKKDGTPVEGFVNILLGSETYERKVSICTKMTKKGAKTYGDIRMTSADIIKMVADARAAYKASQKAAQQAEAEAATA